MGAVSISISISISPRAPSSRSSRAALFLSPILSRQHLFSFRLPKVWFRAKWERDAYLCWLKGRLKREAGGEIQIARRRCGSWVLLSPILVEPVGKVGYEPDLKLNKGPAGASRDSPPKSENHLLRPFCCLSFFGLVSRVAKAIFLSSRERRFALQTFPSTCLRTLCQELVP